VAETTIDGLKTKPGDIIYYDLAVEYSLTKKVTAIIELNCWNRAKPGKIIGCRKNPRQDLYRCFLPWNGYCRKGFIIFGVSISFLGKNADYGLTRP